MLRINVSIQLKKKLSTPIINATIKAVLKPFNSTFGMYLAASNSTPASITM